MACLFFPLGSGGRKQEGRHRRESPPRLRPSPASETAARSRRTSSQKAGTKPPGAAIFELEVCLAPVACLPAVDHVFVHPTPLPLQEAPGGLESHLPVECVDR